jgi:catechol 2,3-dioxygenase-like lactoylglutathione lyase family enzyme
MIDHVGINVSDYERSKAFYVVALAPLGYELGIEWEGRSAGFVEKTGVGRKPSFWLEATRTPVTENVHISFGARDRATVDAFHAAALAAGGTDNGPPGVREIYHPHYYGAFVHDPDGNNVEAVCHRPVGQGGEGGPD